MAEKDGEPVVSDEWLAGQIATANELFEGSDLAVTEASHRTLDAPAPDVMTVADRHALARHAPRDGRIHVFVVDRLADKDEDGAFIRGVHWRYRGDRRGYRGRRYIILSAIAMDEVLAHELGHFFGLSHVDQKDNLMSYRRTGERGPFLTRRQQARVERRLRRAVRSGLVAPLPDGD